MKNIVLIHGTDSPNRCSQVNRVCSPYGPERPKVKGRVMAVMILALLVLLGAASIAVLVDSGLHLWSAHGLLARQRALLEGQLAENSAQVGALDAMASRARPVAAYPVTRAGHAWASSAASGGAFNSGPLRAAA